MVSREQLERLREMLRTIGDETGTVFMLLASERRDPIDSEIATGWVSTAEGPWCGILHQVGDAYHAQICVPRGWDKQGLLRSGGFRA